jgi:hypothetical protein
MPIVRSSVVVGGIDLASRMNTALAARDVGSWRRDGSYPFIEANAFLLRV